MKTKFVLTIGFLLVFGVLDVYSQSDKLIGTWVSTDRYEEYGNDFTMVRITNDKITAGKDSWSWSDNNDGMTLEIDEAFALYVVTDTTLLIELPAQYGGYLKRYYLTKEYVAPVSNLIGKWVMPEFTADYEVTITETEISVKRGRTTRTSKYHFDDKSPNILQIETGYSSQSKFFFLDETHLYCTLPILGPGPYGDIGGGGESIYILTKQ